MPCRQAAEAAPGEMQDELSKLADDLVQKCEDQWKDTAENLDAASMDMHGDNRTQSKALSRQQMLPCNTVVLLKKSP